MRFVYIRTTPSIPFDLYLRGTFRMSIKIDLLRHFENESQQLMRIFVEHKAHFFQFKYWLTIKRFLNNN
jgi:hypothetical protein